MLFIQTEAFPRHLLGKAVHAFAIQAYFRGVEMMRLSISAMQESLLPINRNEEAKRLHHIRCNKYYRGACRRTTSPSHLDDTAQLPLRCHIDPGGTQRQMVNSSLLIGKPTE